MARLKELERRQLRVFIAQNDFKRVTDFAITKKMTEKQLSNFVEKTINRINQMKGVLYVF